MNKVIKLFLIYLYLFLIFGCNFFKEETATYNEVKVNDVPKDFLLPRQIFNLIQAEIVQSNQAVKPVYIFSPLEVIIKSEDNEVVKNNPLHFIFPNGGGEIDLKKYINGQGSFYLSFPEDQFKNLPELQNLFFISDRPKKKISNEVFGLGCGYFVDLKSKFNLLKKENFLKLNTTDLRHLLVASGFYIFVFRENNKFYLSQLNIFDSRYSEDSCSNVFKK